MENESIEKDYNGRPLPKTEPLTMLQLGLHFRYITQQHTINNFKYDIKFQISGEGSRELPREGERVGAPRRDRS